MAKQNGLRKAIIAALQTKDRMYSHEIAEIVGASTRSVANAIYSIKEIYRVKDSSTRWSHCVYSLKPIGSLKKPEPSVKKEKPRRYVPEFRPMTEKTYNLYAGRQLAMLSR